MLSFALCADPDVAGAIAFADLTIPIVWSHVRARSCLDVVNQGSGDVAGLTRFETGWTSQRIGNADGTSAGRVVVRLEDARIEMIAFDWKKMSAVDRDALRGTYRATLWHELGHLITAQTSIEAANADGTFPAGDAVDFQAAARARGAAAIAAINADQIAYDQRVEHGIRQHALPPPLGGPDTIIVCASR